MYLSSTSGTFALLPLSYYDSSLPPASRLRRSEESTLSVSTLGAGLLPGRSPSVAPGTLSADLLSDPLNWAVTLAAIKSTNAGSSGIAATTGARLLGASDDEEPAAWLSTSPPAVSAASLPLAVPDIDIAHVAVLLG